MPKKATFYKKTHKSAPKIFNENENDNEKGNENDNEKGYDNDIDNEKGNVNEKGH